MGKDFVPCTDSVEVVQRFLKNLQTLDKHANDPQGFKQAVSTTARLAGTALEAVGGRSASPQGS